MVKPVVLFVDDEPEILEILQDIFIRSKIEVQCFASGKAAIQACNKKAIDIIVCDLMLNDISGLEVLAFFKQTSPKTYRILMTGYLDDEKERNAKKQGLMQDTIPKPWDIFQVQQKIESLLTVSLSSRGD